MRAHTPIYTICTYKTYTCDVNTQMRQLQIEYIHVLYIIYMNYRSSYFN